MRSGLSKKNEAFAAIVGVLSCGICSGCGEGQSGQTWDPQSSDRVETVNAASPGTGQGMLLDCGSPANEHDNRCIMPVCPFGAAIGSGPRMCPRWGSSDVLGGFVDTESNRLIVVVVMGEQQYTVVLAVDLASGDRTVISGGYEDAATGPTPVRGTGPSLSGIQNVQPLPDGNWLAGGSGWLMKIDPSSGNRTAVLDNVQSNALTCAGTSSVLFHSWANLVVAEDGTIYSTAKGRDGDGVVKVVTSPLACTVISFTGPNMLGETNDPSSIIGGGPTDRFMAEKVSFYREAIWILSGTSLFIVDPATGNRRRVSDWRNRVGSGDVELGGKALTIANGGAWVLGNYPINSFVKVDVSSDPPSGNRRNYPIQSGPVSGPGDAAGVWALPNSELLVTSVSGAFVYFDPDTGNSATFSL